MVYIYNTLCVDLFSDLSSFFLREKIARARARRRARGRGEGGARGHARGARALSQSFSSPNTL